MTYFSTATERRALSRAIAHSVASGRYRPEPVDLWFLERQGKQSCGPHARLRRPRRRLGAVPAAHPQCACCYGLPGVYSYLPGMTNVSAVRALADYIRAHRRTGASGPPLYVLQSDFESYGDNLPVGPDAALWSTCAGSRRWAARTARSPRRSGNSSPRWPARPCATATVPSSPGCTASPMGTPARARCSAIWRSCRWTRPSCRSTASSTPATTTTSSSPTPTCAALHEADARIDSLLGPLGVKRKTRQGAAAPRCAATPRPAPSDPAYRGRNRIDYLGMSVSHSGTVAPGPHRLRRFIGRIAARIDAAGPALSPLPETDRARHLVQTVNVMLDAADPFAVPGLTALLDLTTDRGTSQGPGLPDRSQDRAGRHRTAGCPRFPDVAARSAAPRAGAGVAGAAAELALTADLRKDLDGRARTPPSAVAARGYRGCGFRPFNFDAFLPRPRLLPPRRDAPRVRQGG